MKRLLFFVLFVLATLSVPVAAKRFTRGFRVAKMKLDYPAHTDWDVAIDPEVYAILDQPFYYIDKGAQSYVFESRDRKYVIKFFRFDYNSLDSRFGLQTSLKRLKSIWRPDFESREVSSEKVLKIETLFNACKIAYTQLKEETGLVYIHLNPTIDSLPVLSCKDALGRKYRLPLDRFRFALQKKASSFRLILEEAKSNPVMMKKRMDQFIDLLLLRASKGVFNTDPTLSRNFGFLDDRAIEIDFGNYRLSSEHNQRAEMIRYTERLRRWLSTEAPEWVAYLDERTRAFE